MHTTIEPSILYFGTPVVLVSTLNDDGSTNIAPMSSAWWLGWSCMLGLDASSKTTENLKRTNECVLNLPADHNVSNVNRLALLTGSRSVPLHKQALGYRYSPNKWEASGFTPLESEVVKPSRIKECPIHLEASVSNVYPFGRDDTRMAIPGCAIELTVIRIHAESDLVEAGSKSRVDPNKWRPLIMSFRHFYGLTDNIHESRLAAGAEERYAPWKKNGLKRVATEALLKLANRKYVIK
jgi:flavin reductase (DIM6/NTAB) family NADH-FMN oxidoreductase RutF